MRAPKRKRQQFRRIVPAPAGINLADLVGRVSYVGSPEHKIGVSFAGQARPRADATKCDVALNGRLVDIERWLRHAIEIGCCGTPWEGEFPRYLWCRVGDVVYEARLVNKEQGQYKGYELDSSEWPPGIDNFDWNF